VDNVGIDLKREQEATLARPRHTYSASARFFFRSMDAMAGPEDTLPKVKVIESLASIPYRAWENRQYDRITRHYGDPDVMQKAEAILRYGRAAQDNEVQHLRIIEEKLRREGIPDPRFMTRPLPELMVDSYQLFSGTLARLGIRRAFVLNAEFEDHAEHTYAELVAAHPEWEDAPVEGDAVREYAAYHGLDGFACWADVFRRIGLDERDHRNASFAFAGMYDHIVRYEGMPEVAGEQQMAA
jgi:ubiquinol oxidase